MLNEILSAVILFTFVILLAIGAVSTALRALRYRRLGIQRPVLLNRDRDLLIGLAFPFLLIAIVRAFGLQPLINDEAGQPHIWWLLLTGIPPIYALARYDYFELRVIERVERRRGRTETPLEREDRQVGDTRRDLQAQARDNHDPEASK